MKKKVLFIVALFFMILFALTIKVNAEEYDYNLTFYAIDDELLEEFPELAIPSNYRRKYKMVIDGKTLKRKYTI